MKPLLSAEYAHRLNRAGVVLALCSYRFPLTSLLLAQDVWNSPIVKMLMR
jgi:hypothetical protein